MKRRTAAVIALTFAAAALALCSCEHRGGFFTAHGPAEKQRSLNPNHNRQSKNLKPIENSQSRKTITAESNKAQIIQQHNQSLNQSQPIEPKAISHAQSSTPKNRETSNPTDSLIPQSFNPTNQPIQ